MSDHPYKNLPDNRFWRLAVSERSLQDVDLFWTPKFKVDAKTVIATAGSCFAQNFSKALVKRRYAWRDFEPGPRHLTDAQRHDYHYGTFSFRTGNIYTVAMLRQWLNWAFGTEEMSAEVWEKDGRFFDPFRPAIEPGGFSSLDEVQKSRAACLAAIREAITTTDVFVFTLGLTESWVNKETGVEYAICPGTVAGDFDPKQHEFVNRDFGSISQDLKAVLEILQKQNPKIRVLLTVSPVPLTATASEDHVVVATSYSKSVLRAVAGQHTQSANVDYFPSYEIFASPFSRAQFYKENLRNVGQAGVDFAMDMFFKEQARVFGGTAEATAKIVEPDRPPAQVIETEDNVRCEEELLDAFKTGH